MVNGIGIIRDSFQNFTNSLHHAVRRLLSLMLGGTDGQVLVRLDDETCRLLADFAERSRSTPEEAAACWLALQASAYQQDQAVAQQWAALTPREQQVVATLEDEFSALEDRTGVKYKRF
jgi:hypothetical protein